ncbi:MAG: tRNA lysidine(34) synthetase TilS [bacterium]
MPITMQAKVEKTIERHQLFERGNSVLVGLSGGPDSVALLHVLHRLPKQWRLSIEAVCINHCLRVRQAQREEQFCQELCDRLGVVLHIVRQDIKQLTKTPTTGLEEAGRRFRYGVYETLADSEGFDRVALGHHADDRVETILLNLFRGSGRAGVMGMPIRRDKIVRPLFECSKDEILDYLKSLKAPYCLDNSNRDCRFRRNFIRNRLLPLLRNRINPEVDQALLNAADILAEEEVPLAQFFERAKGNAVRVTPGGKIELDMGAFASYDRWLRSRLLRYCIATVSGGQAASRQTVERLSGWIDTTKRSLSIPGKVQVERIDGKLVFNTDAPTAYEAALTRGRWLPLQRPTMKLRWSCPRTRPGRAELGADPNRVWLDRDRVSPPLTVRNYRPGDRWRPLGMTGAKKVARYLIDKKVPMVYRDEIPVVCDQEGIVWLVGYEIADRVKIDPSTKEVIKIECAKRKGPQTPAV